MPELIDVAPGSPDYRDPDYLRRVMGYWWPMRGQVSGALDKADDDA
jgi:hypothetical protein